MLDFRSYCLFEDTLQHTPGLSWDLLLKDLKIITNWYNGRWMHDYTIAPADKQFLQEAFHRICGTVGWVPKEETLYRDVGWHALAGGTIPVKGWSGTVSVSNKEVQSWTDKKSLAQRFNKQIHSWQSESRYSVVVQSDIPADQQLVNQNSMIKFIDAAGNFFITILGMDYNGMATNKALSPEVLDKFEKVLPFANASPKDLIGKIIHDFHYLHFEFTQDTLAQQDEIVVVGPRERHCKILEVFNS